MVIVWAHGIPWKFSWVDTCNFHGMHGIPWNSTSYYGHHGIPWGIHGFTYGISMKYIPQYFMGIPWCFMVILWSHGIPWKFSYIYMWNFHGVHEMPWSFMGIPWCSMEKPRSRLSHGSFHGFRYRVSMEYMESHSILREYHGVPWPLYGPMVFHGSFHGFRYGVFMEYMKSDGILLKCHGIPWKLHWVSIETP